MAEQHPVPQKPNEPENPNDNATWPLEVVIVVLSAVVSFVVLQLIFGSIFK